MDLKIPILFLSCLIVIDASITIRPGNRLVLATLPPVTEPQFTECTQYKNGNDFWFSWSGSNFCYLFSQDEYASWQEAVDDCRSKKADLASIHDFNTNFIISHPKKMPSYSYAGYYWIGLSSLNSTQGRSYFKWSDGSAYNYQGNISDKTTSGSKLDPNIYSQGRCMSMYIYPQSNSYYYKYFYDKIGQWFKDECGNARNYLCRRNANPNVTPPTPTPTSKPTQGGCPDGWYKFGNQKCIKYFPKPGNFSQAQAVCAQTPGAEMLSIHSQKEQDFVSIITYGLQSPWIGLNRKYYYYQWLWDDGSKVDFTSFGVQEGTSPLYYWNCVTVNTNQSQHGKWLKTNCSDIHPVLCGIPYQSSDIKTGLTLDSNKCKIQGFANYIQFRNSCYHIVDDPSSKLGFSDAEAACKNNGAHLASIVDGYEESFLRYYLSTNGKLNRYWIGLQSKVDGTDVNNQYQANASQVFEWTDDWPVYYTNWGPEEPKTLDVPDDQCVYMGSQTGNWITNECSTPMGYVCKTSADKPPVFSGDRNGYCPTLNDNDDPSLNWVNLHKGTPFCYWFSTERKGLRGTAGLLAYSDAKFNCLRRNGTLVSIHSEHQMNLISNRLSKKMPNFISWIGLSRNPAGEFIWEDNSPIDYMNGLPVDDLANMTDLNNDDGILCAKLKFDNTWEWGSCLSQERHYYVCQVSKLYASSSPSSSPGKTAGIVIGVLLAIAVVAGVVYYMRRNSVSLPAMPSFENPLSRGRSQRGTGIKPEKFENSSPNALTNPLSHDNPFKDGQHSQE